MKKSTLRAFGHRFPFPHVVKPFSKRLCGFCVISQKLSNNQHLAKLPDRKRKQTASSGPSEPEKLLSSSPHKQI